MKTKNLSAAAVLLMLTAACHQADESAPSAASAPAAASTAVASASAAAATSKQAADWSQAAAYLCQRRSGLWADVYLAVPDPQACLSEEAANPQACFEQQGQQFYQALPAFWQQRFGSVQTEFQIDEYGTATLSYVLPVVNGRLYGIAVERLIMDVSLEDSDSFGTVEAVLQLGGSLPEAQQALKNKWAQVEKYYVDDAGLEDGTYEFDSRQAALDSFIGLAASEVSIRSWQPQLMQNNRSGQVELLCLLTDDAA